MGECIKFFIAEPEVRRSGSRRACSACLRSPISCFNCTLACDRLDSTLRTRESSSSYSMAFSSEIAIWPESSCKTCNRSGVKTCVARLFSRYNRPIKRLCCSKGRHRMDFACRASEARVLREWPFAGRVVQHHAFLCAGHVLDHGGGQQQWIGLDGNRLQHLYLGAIGRACRLDHPLPALVQNQIACLGTRVFDDDFDQACQESAQHDLGQQSLSSLHHAG